MATFLDSGARQIILAIGTALTGGIIGAGIRGMDGLSEAAITMATVGLAAVVGYAKQASP